jgi:hypothetical protein
MVPSPPAATTIPPTARARATASRASACTVAGPVDQEDAVLPAGRGTQPSSMIRRVSAVSACPSRR